MKTKNEDLTINADFIDADFDDMDVPAETLQAETDAQIATYAMATTLPSHMDGIDRRNLDDSREFKAVIGKSVDTAIGRRAQAMGLSSDEMEAIRGLHIAEAYETYADDHDIRKCQGVPSKDRTSRAIAQGQTFWMVYQAARGQHIEPTGKRRPMSNHYALKVTNHAVKSWPDVAKSAVEFAKTGVSPYTEQVATEYGRLKTWTDMEWRAHRTERSQVKAGEVNMGGEARKKHKSRNADRALSR